MLRLEELCRHAVVQQFFIRRANLTMPLWIHTMYRTIHLLQLKDCGDIPSLFVSGVGEYEVMAMGDF